MRVYEYSKQNGIPNKEIIKILQDGGFKIQNHMSVLTPEGLDFLNKKLKIDNKEEPKLNIATKDEKVSKAISDKETKPQVKVKPVEIKEAQQEIERDDHLEDEKNKIVISVKSMSLGELAEKLEKSASELILSLLKKGMSFNKNQILKEELVEQIAKQFGAETIKEKTKVIEPVFTEIKKVTHKLIKRLPIVVVMGHVDHGKTTLLDFIRKTRVAAKEKGGITQHLGAYQVATKQGKMVFLDTPGHEAFSMMRMRGARVADLVIIVVAADDGIMPQTIEAIKIAQAKNIPIIVAINKADKVETSRVEEVKGQLSKQGLMPEEWGGTTICVPISAKLGQGIDQLLDMIVLQSEMMELTADETIDACGYILESKIEKGLGPVATFIAQHGKIKIGDFFICGNILGKVTVMIDSYGKRIQEAGPSEPIQISGFYELPQVGEYLQVVSAEEFKKAKSNNALEKKVSPALKAIPHEAVNIILKTDNESSKEALLNSIDQLFKKSKKEIYLVNSGVGNITESDIILASSTGSVIYGFGVKSDAIVANLASQNGVSIRLFDIIYKLLDDIKDLLKSKEEIETKKVKIGEAIVRKVFDIKGLGVISGFYVKEGKIVRNGNILIFRANKKIGEGSIKSLQREKKVMKEVAAGFEGALIIEGYGDWQVEDRIECYIEVPVNQ